MKAVKVLLVETVKEKALQKAVEANSLAGRSPGDLPRRAVIWGD
jgi:hypothetical protein